jgi:hypothetical protein
MAVYLYRLNAQQWQPCCTRCGWTGASVVDVRRAARAAAGHNRVCQAVPTKPVADIEDPDGAEP